MNRFLALLVLVAMLSPAAQAQRHPFKLKKAPRGFVRLFDGVSLKGWTLVGGTGPGYVPENGVLIVPSDGGGNLFTVKNYADFIFRFEFKLTPGGNNGIGLRAPLEGDAAYVGMECQVLDDSSPQYANLLPGQYHGSIYKVLPAKRGSQKKVGEWNKEEITVIGGRVKVKVNGKVIVNGNLDDVKDPAILAEHPGIQRRTGRIGFLGHGPSEVQFREVFVRDLSR